MKTNPIRKRFLRTLSLLLTALLMAGVVWAIAINTIDPMEKRIYPKPITLEVSGLDETLEIAEFNQPEIELILTAPQSAWSTLINNPRLIHAYVDLSGLASGEMDLEVRIKIDLPAVRLEDAIPRVLHFRLVPKNP
jgi:hypothetical protein